MITVETKVCSKCKIEKEVVNFYKACRNRDGYKTYCKECGTREYYKRKYGDNLPVRVLRYSKPGYKLCAGCRNYCLLDDFIVNNTKTDKKDYFCKACNKSKKQKYYRQNKERIDNARKLYAENNSESIKKYKAQWFQNNKERIKPRQRELAELEPNKQKRKEEAKIRRQSNIETILIRERKHRLEHPELQKQYRDKYRAKEYVKDLLYDQAIRRRAIQYKAEGSYTKKELIQKSEEFQWRCAYCFCALNKKTVTADHIIPLVKKGSNYISNIVPSCKLCNCSKGFSDLNTWLWRT